MFPFLCVLVSLCGYSAALAMTHVRSEVKPSGATQLLDASDSTETGGSKWIASCPDGYEKRSGDVPGTGLSGSWNGGSIWACRNKCNRRRSWCTSFEYSASRKRCNLNKIRYPSKSPYQDYIFCSSTSINNAYKESKYVAKRYCTACEVKLKGSSVSNALGRCSWGIIPGWTDVTDNPQQTNYVNRRRMGRRRGICYSPTFSTLPPVPSEDRKGFDNWLTSYDAGKVCECLAQWQQACSTSSSPAECVKLKMCLCQRVCHSFKVQWGCYSSLSEQNLTTSDDDSTPLASGLEQRRVTAASSEENFVLSVKESGDQLDSSLDGKCG